MADNVITISGTATRDPELRYTSGGRGVASLGVAWNDRYFDKTTDKWVDGDATFFNVTAWGTLGENLAASITKGTRVMVTGRMKSRSYETQDGEKRTVWDITADDIGPSLKWAQAQVEKTEREKSDRGAGPVSERAKDPIYGDEEPF
jgi:single-strand DNA-binding protein